MTTTAAEGTRTQQVIGSVRQKFSVAQEFLREDGMLEFHIDRSQPDTKTKFLSLIAELRTTGDSAVLRRKGDGGGLYLLVFKKPAPAKNNLKKPLILLAVTILFIAADGFIRVSGYHDPLTTRLTFSGELYVAMIYAAALVAIIGIHELGHKVASWYHKMNSSWPYFIPGIPGVWPTMGAVISSREPPVNKDSLFDLGLSGPIAGLVATVAVSIAAIASAKLIPANLVTGTSSADLYTTFLISAFYGHVSSSYAIGGPMFSLLYFAYSIGFLLTFVNLLPAWQLDGGHIANSAVSPRVHKYLTYASVIIMILAGFWLMAFLVLILASKTRSMRPLDDVSPLSSKRRIMFVLTWVLSAGIFAFVIYGNLYFGVSQLI